MKFTRQFDQMDCGPACIRMVASAYGKDYPLSYLRSLSHLTREGVSVAGIRDALKEIGMESATFEMTLEQLRDKCPLPAILHWEQNHFVVLYDIRKSTWTGEWRYCIASSSRSVQSRKSTACCVLLGNMCGRSVGSCRNRHSACCCRSLRHS
ncbi:MAG: cysteine peptidase family C39 domain-containing protein [Bacteroides sp.]|nr:cysteine peptidase family C39 domain-containing protein [Bacteroides sp.]MCM1448461.1 cysteine peptidase family C39 domain-containing protein [Bacteroides sp.]MCM1516535.1 cysteine peptidase family C39 domain-containing protein [Paraprevotella sp.]